MTEFASWFSLRSPTHRHSAQEYVIYPVLHSYVFMLTFSIGEPYSWMGRIVPA